ncbi:MAG TPA: hypothetical protein VIL36_17795, partial [Acidimicrobiales bacterium]
MPFRRLPRFRRRATAPVAAPASASAAAVAEPPGWTVVAPLGRSFGSPAATFKIGATVAGDMVAWRSPQLVGTIGHGVSAGAPAGVVQGLLTLAPPLVTPPRRPTPTAPPLDLPLRRLPAAPPEDDGDSPLPVASPTLPLDPSLATATVPTPRPNLVPQHLDPAPAAGLVQGTAEAPTTTGPVVAPNLDVMAGAPVPIPRPSLPPTPGSLPRSRAGSAAVAAPGAPTAVVGGDAEAAVVTEDGWALDDGVGEVSGPVTGVVPTVGFDQATVLRAVVGSAGVPRNVELAPETGSQLPVSGASSVEGAASVGDAGSGA